MNLFLIALAMIAIFTATWLVVTFAPIRKPTKWPEVLTSADGAFSCGSDHAVELAYMLNCAEGRLSQDRSFSTSDLVRELIRQYLEGEISPAEVIKELTEEADSNTSKTELKPI